MGTKVPVRDGLVAIVSEHPGVLRRREARKAIAAGDNSAGTWASAYCRHDASGEELSATAEAIAWQGVVGAEIFRQKCREEFGL